MSGLRVVIVEVDYTTPEPRDDATSSRVIVGYLLIVTTCYTDIYRYTQKLEGLAVATLWGFESPLPHQHHLEPIAPFCSHMLASTLAVARRFGDAIEQVHRTLELDSTYLGAYWVLGLATTALGKYQDAVKLMQPGIPSAREDVLLMAHLAYAQALAGHPEEAEQILDRLQERRRSRFTSP